MLLRQYYELTKPGIIYANVLTAIAGYLFGSAWQVQPKAFLGVTFGTACIIGGACVFNNVMDRRIDATMRRTRPRALVTGIISTRAALCYGAVLTVLGFGMLLTTNWYVVLVGLVGVIDYVLLYGWAKRHTSFSTLVGSVSGSASVVAGYCAATARFDGAAVVLFLLLTIWQMPHFYAIALYRRGDYAAAKLPVMPVVRSAATAQFRILVYVALFLVVSVLFTTQQYAGALSLIILGVLSIIWLTIGISTFRASDPQVWGKRMFLFSLVVNLGLSLAITIGSIAP